MHANLSSTDTVVILTYLRGVYDQCLGTNVNFSRFSPTGTLTGTLTEVGTNPQVHEEYVYSVVA